MNHAAEGLLQAYLDGEATRDAAAEIEGHMAGCEDCRAELERMRTRSVLVSSALQQLDASAPAAAERAWWRVQAEARKPAARRFSWSAAGALTRAAAVLLVCAGALAAIPGSPLRQLISRLFSEAQPAAPVVAPPAPAVRPEPAPTPPAVARPSEMPGAVLVPSEGRVRLLVWSARPGATIRVNLVAGSRVSVQAGSDAEDVRFRSGNGRIEVMNLGAGAAVIEIPRSLPFASLDVDGRQWLFKDGDQLRLNGPVVQQARDAVVFRLD